VVGCCLNGGKAKLLPAISLELKILQRNMQNTNRNSGIFGCCSYQADARPICVSKTLEATNSIISCKAREVTRYSTKSCLALTIFGNARNSVKSNSEGVFSLFRSLLLRTLFGMFYTLYLFIA